MKIIASTEATNFVVDKIHAIRALRKYIPIGLREAKDAVESIMEGNVWRYDFNGFVNSDINQIIESDVIEELYNVGLNVRFAKEGNYTPCFPVEEYPQPEYNSTTKLKELIKFNIDQNQFDMAMDLLTVLAKHQDQKFAYVPPFG